MGEENVDDLLHWPHVSILALLGDFTGSINALGKLGVEVVPVLLAPLGRQKVQARCGHVNGLNTAYDCVVFPAPQCFNQIFQQGCIFLAQCVKCLLQGLLQSDYACFRIFRAFIKRMSLGARLVFRAAHFLNKSRDVIRLGIVSDELNFFSQTLQIIIFIACWFTGGNSAIFPAVGGGSAS